MTKEEVSSMLNAELENLERQCNEAYQKIDYFRNINTKNGSSGSKELQEANYQLSLIYSKIDTVRNLISLPAYARIQAMSDIEIEEYKKDSIAELDLKIQEIRAREEVEKTKLSKLKAQQQELISQFGSLSGTERDNAVYKGQQLQAEISRYESKEHWGVFPCIQREIQEVEKLQEQIRAKMPQEIKNEMTTQLKDSRNIIQILENTNKYSINVDTQLKAAVANNPEKAQQMATLLTYYRKLDDEKAKVKGRMSLGFGLPKMLEKKLTEYDYYYNSNTREVSDPDKLSEIVAKFEETFTLAKERFQAHFTTEKLGNLVGKEYGVKSLEVNMPFLQSHSDKLTDGELKHLQSIVDQRDSLSKKLFKSRDVKHEIDILNETIKNEQTKIYKQIIGWYQSQSKEILGYSNGVSFHNLEVMQQDLESMIQVIHRSENAITQVKENIQKVKSEIERQKQDYENKKIECTQQIRILAGPQFAEAKISYSSDDKKYNLENIIGASRQVQQAEIINRVQKEAQNQADIREAELRGITIEQLMQIKTQAQHLNMTEPISKINSEEFTGEIKK